MFVLALKETFPSRDLNTLLTCKGQLGSHLIFPQKNQALEYLESLLFIETRLG